ncbi:MAG: cell division ATP-binding protein FtsE [Nitrospirae bacterium]|nr:MAG: cell division ATP-binding protein FtsE [Nitrospirota bacterium]
MIEFYHVSKTYNGWPALHDVSFKIGKGEFVFLTGPSGAGKTTLLRLIFRADAPDKGQILVNNRNLLHIRESEVPYLRRMIGFVFQDFRLLPKRTVFENVALALKVSGVPEGVLRVRVAETLGAVGLGHKLDAMPMALSAGEQQRMCLARAIVNDPQILLADEPTGNLDADLSGEILELMKSANARGTTVVLATHNRELLKRWRRRVMRLEQGRVAEDGCPET